MNALWIYIVIFFIFLFSFFSTGKHSNNTFPIKEGVLYSAHSESNTITTDQMSQTTLYKDSSSEGSLPLVYLASDIGLPKQFIAHIASKENAKYKVVYSSQAVSYKYKTPLEPNIRTANTIVSKSKRSLLVVKKKENEIVNNSVFYTNIVKNADRTYFFASHEKVIDDVAILVVSLTPYAKDSILKVKIINRQKGYFFLSNISLLSADKKLLTAQYFFDPLVPSDKSIDCLIVMPQSKGTSYVLNLIESGGKSRLFTVPFTTPN